jgi:hypothetical protein
MTIVVVPVRSRRDRSDFVALPHKLYARDVHWIAPLDSAVKRAMDAEANPFHQEAFVEHFVARDARGECVGRVAAVVHPAHNRRHGAKAFFGQFESTNDPNVARALLASVEGWSDARGFRVVQGPCSYTMTQEAGLLVEGFEEQPVLLQSYNPPYYADLLRTAGYDVSFHMSTFKISRDTEAAAVESAMQRGDTAREQLGLSARSIDMSQFAQELERIRLCYNAAFSAHPETVAIERAVFADQANDMKSILDPRLVRIVERRGVPVAFSVAVPNVYELLAPSRGRLTLSLLLRWKRLLRQVRSMVVIMIGGEPTLAGEAPAARSRAMQGVGSCLAAELAHALCEANYQTVHTTWIHERNWRALSLMRAIGAKPSKRYAIYERSVA